MRGKIYIKTFLNFFSIKDLMSILQGGKLFPQINKMYSITGLESFLFRLLRILDLENE